MMPLFIRSLLVASLLVSCSSSTSITPDGAGGTGGPQAGSTSNAGTQQAGATGDAGASGSSSLTGTITLSLKAANEATMAKAFSVAGGSIYDGPVPEAFPLSVALEEPGCQLLKPKLPFCSSGCGGDAACVDDETCISYPRAQNVGVLALGGLVGPAPVTMDPFPPSFSYQSPALPYPPCVEGESVRLGAENFGAATSCIAPLIVSSTEIAVRRDQALPLEWEAPAQPDQTRLLIKLDVSHHGGKKGEIDCDVPDTGHFEIPASLVTALVDLGLAGFPTIVLTRTASASSPEQPSIRFEISSGREREVDTGVESCTEDADCATDERCDPDKLVCV